MAANLPLLQAASLANFSHLAQPFQAAAPQASQGPSESTTFGFSFNALGASAAPAASRRLPRLPHPRRLRGTTTCLPSTTVLSWLLVRRSRRSLLFAPTDRPS